MPIYEYRCESCGRKSSVFFRGYSDVADPVCPRCGASNLRRLFSRVAVLKSEESRLDDMADPSSMLSGLDENDPKSIARWARRMSQEVGEDLGPEFHEAIDRIEAGEDPDQVMGEMDEGAGPGESDDGFGGPDL